MRLPRFVPVDETGWGVAEVTARTVRGIFLLRPSTELNERIVGIVGRAQRKTGVKIHNLDYQVNHHHMLLSVRSARHLADFMHRVQQQVSVELRVRLEWSGSVWEGPYKPSFPGHHPRDLARRFRYVLAQGCSAGLVSSPRKWPGVNAAKALCAGEFVIKGKRVDRTAMSRGRRSKVGRRRTREADFLRSENVRLSKLPGWENTSDADYCSWVRGLVEDIEKETSARHRHEKTRPMGQWNILRQSPIRMPKKVAWGPRPRVTAKDPEEKARLLNTFSAVYEAYALARERLRGGDLLVKFPSGTFPPPRAFVPVPDLRAGP